MKTSEQRNIAIIGGGASGIFAAIRCAEVAKEKNIPTVLASALFRQSQIFFQFYLSQRGFRPLLKCLNFYVRHFVHTH